MPQSGKQSVGEISPLVIPQHLTIKTAGQRIQGRGHIYYIFILRAQHSTPGCCEAARLKDSNQTKVT